MALNEVLIKLGFTNEEVVRLPEDFGEIINDYYSLIELEGMQKKEILLGAGFMYQVFNKGVFIDVDGFLEGKDLFSKEDKDTKKEATNTNASNDLKEDNSNKLISWEKVEGFLKDKSLREKHWGISYLLTLEKMQAFLGKLESLLNETKEKISKRGQLFDYFEQYLKKGKQTKELLNTTLFVDFKKEVFPIIQNMNENALQGKEQFNTLYKKTFKKEDTRKQEMLLIRMVYDLLSNQQSKKIVYEIYIGWEEKQIEKQKLEFINFLKTSLKV